MSRSISDFLQSFLKNITSYYTATYSSDTDLYAILEMYGAELASGSLALETTRDNLFVIACENSKLTDNFGTYFGQLKYFDQDYSEDSYTSSVITWRESGSAIFEQKSQITNLPFGAASSNAPYVLQIGYPTDTIVGLPIRHAVIHNDRIFASVGFKELTAYASVDTFHVGNAVAIVENPKRNTRVISWNPVTNVWKSHDAFNIGWAHDVSKIIPVFGFAGYSPYLGRGEYDIPRIGWYDMTLWAGAAPPAGTGGGQLQTIPANITRIFFQEYTNPYDFDTEESSGSFSSIIMYADPSEQLGSNFSIILNAVNFHDKIYTAFAIKEKNYSDVTSYKDSLPMLSPNITYRWPLCIEYTPNTYRHREIGLATAVKQTKISYAHTFSGDSVWGQVFKGSTTINDLFNFQSRMYTTTNTGMYRSDLDGEAFSNCLSASSLGCIATSGSSLLTARSAGGGILLYQSDDGNTWSSVTTPGGTCNSLVTFTSISGSYTYAGLNSVCQVSSTPYVNKLKTVWTALQAFGQSRVTEVTGSGSYIFAATANDSPVRGRIYRSASGDSGSFIHVFSEPQDCRISTLYGDFGYLYVGTLNDSGSSFIYRTPSGDEGTYVPVIQFVHSVQDITYASGSFWATVGDVTGGGEFWTSPSGVSGSWTLHTSVPASIDSYSSVYAITPRNTDNTVYASVGTAVFRSPAGTSAKVHANYTVNQIFTFNNALWLDIYGQNSEDSTHNFGYLVNYTTSGSWITNKTAPITNILTNTVRKYVSFKDTLYAIVDNSIKKYNVTTDTWTTHTTFDGLNAVDMYIYANALFISARYGSIYVLDETTDTFVLFYQFDASANSTIRSFISDISPISLLYGSLYGWYDSGWYSSSYQQISNYTYFWPGPTISGIGQQNTVIPSYHKQLEFMIEAAMLGGTRKGITRAANAFTLINPDIREPYTLPQWQLKQIDYGITQLSTNTWQLTGTPNLRINEFIGAHATFVSGSTPQNKVAAAYLVILNDNNTVTVGAIEDKRLLLELVRPS